MMLIERIADLEAENKRLREALGFYAKREHYPMPIMEITHFELVRDGGARARAALEAR